MSFDLNRGVTMRRHPHGFLIIMPKDRPGIYYNEAGVEVEPPLAAEAGFDVARDSVDGQRLAEVAAAIAEINKRYALVQPGEVVETIGDYRVVCATKDRFDVYGPDNERITRQSLGRQAATDFARKLKPSTPTKE